MKGYIYFYHDNNLIYSRQWQSRNERASFIKEYKEKTKRSKGLLHYHIVITNANKVWNTYCEQYDVRGRFLERFSSVQAACKAIGASQPNMSRVISKGKTYYKGYKWKFYINEI